MLKTWETSDVSRETNAVKNNVCIFYELKNVRKITPNLTQNPLETKPKTIKHIQKTVKETNSLIDNFSVLYGSFVDNIYKDYINHLTEINFKLLNK